MQDTDTGEQPVVPFFVVQPAIAAAAAAAADDDDDDGADVDYVVGLSVQRRLLAAKVLFYPGLNCARAVTDQTVSYTK